MGLFDIKKEAKEADFSNVRSGSSSTPDASAQPEAAPSRYTVRKGDTLSAIAKREYGNAGEWRQDGQVVDETTQTISAAGAAVTEFHISMPDGFPAGQYQLELLLNGQSTERRSFTIQ